MAGKGKVGRAAPKAGAKHTARRSAHKEIKDGRVTNGAIRRLARRGGVKRISLDTHQHVRDYVDDFLNKIVRDSLSYAEHRKARTISALDVVYALKRNGRVIYGYGP
jgi:histone H4